MPPRRWVTRSGGAGSRSSKEPATSRTWRRPPSSTGFFAITWLVAVLAGPESRTLRARPRVNRHPQRSLANRHVGGNRSHREVSDDVIADSGDEDHRSVHVVRHPDVPTFHVDARDLVVADPPGRDPGHHVPR